MRSLLLFGLVLCGACGSAPHDIVLSVPIGSHLSDLDHFLERGAGSKGEVTEWIPKKGRGFTEKELGSYDAWRATAEERDRFTGEIMFTHDGSTSSDVNTLIYEKGQLCKKDWGFLPG